MRDRRVRLAFVGLILSFPVLMVLMNPRAGSARQAALPVLGVEAALACGLATAGRERRRLLAERSAAPTPSPVLAAVAVRLTPGAPHSARPARRVTVGRS